MSTSTGDPTDPFRGPPRPPTHHIVPGGTPHHASSTALPTAAPYRLASRPPRWRSQVTSPRRGAVRTTVAVIALSVAVAAVLLFLPASPLLHLGASGGSNVPGTSPPVACPANASSPAAVFVIGTPAPSAAPASAFILTSLYEVGIEQSLGHSPVGAAPVAVELPDVVASFPMANGTILTLST